MSSSRRAQLTRNLVKFHLMSETKKPLCFAFKKSYRGSAAHVYNRWFIELRQVCMLAMAAALAERTTFPVHINFGEQRELGPTLLRKRFDLRIASRLLPACASHFNAHFQTTDSSAHIKTCVQSPCLEALTCLDKQGMTFQKCRMAAGWALTKLVAWEAEHDQALAAISVI